MRRVTVLEAETGGVRRCVLYASSEGVYVFTRSAPDDGPCDADHWFEDVGAAEAFCQEHFGVVSTSWTAVPDPQPGCQNDWVAPVRVKGRDEGHPQWGIFERLHDDGEWREITENRQNAG